MDDEEKIIQLTVEGQEVILKKSTKGVFHRPANEYGEWRNGLPKGAVWSDVQAMFDDSSY